MNAYGSNPTDESRFRSAIQQLLQNSRVKDEITASVRSRVLLSLSDIQSAVSPPRCNNSNIEEIAILSLVYDFLEHQGMSCTLSVFSAESGFERHGRTAAHRVGNSRTARSFPLSVENAMKALKLESLLDELTLDVEKYKNLNSLCPCSQENKCMKGTPVLVTLLKTLAGQEIGKALKKASYTNIYKDSFAQTVEHIHFPSPQIDNTEENEENIRDDENANRSFEKRLAGVRSELQIQMRQEMKEKMRLSVKKQTIQAISRVEQNHKDQVTLLRQQISSERSKFDRREEELQNKLSQLKISAEKSLHDAERRVQSLRMENESLESKVALVQRSKMHELTEMHEAMGRARSEFMKERDDQKKRFLEESNNLKAKEIRFNSLEKERHAIESELESFRTKHHALLKSNEDLRQAISSSRERMSSSAEALSVSEKKVSDLQSRLSELDISYHATVSELEKSNSALIASRKEVSDLRNLLRQSQSALESLSFHQEEASTPPHEESGKECPIPYLPKSKLEITSQPFNGEHCRTRIDEFNNTIIINGKRLLLSRGQDVPKCENLISGQSKKVAFTVGASLRTAAESSLSKISDKATEVRPRCPDPPAEINMQVHPSNADNRCIQDTAGERAKLLRINSIDVDADLSFKRGIPATIHTDFNLSSIDEIASQDADPNDDQNDGALEKIAPSSNSIPALEAGDENESTSEVLESVNEQEPRSTLKDDIKDRAWNTEPDDLTVHEYSSCSKSSPFAPNEQSENYSESFQTLDESGVRERNSSQKSEKSHSEMEENSYSEKSSTSAGNSCGSADDDDLSESYSDGW
ncbi:hypothetical protein ACHAXS_010131 [Conticribra weissflogii]